MRLDPRGLGIIAISLSILIGVFVIWPMPTPLPPPRYNEIATNPPESILDIVHSNSCRLLGAESYPYVILESINETHFNTYGKDISLFGRFYVVGNGDEKIDFMILTDTGYLDFVDDGSVSDEYVYLRENDTTGFYWEYVLPHYYNGRTVSSWYIIYSAFDKPWWQTFLLERQYRDIYARAWLDKTPPNGQWYIPENQPDDRFLIYLQIYDDRCKVNYSALLIDGSIVAHSPQPTDLVQGPYEWLFSGHAPGSYTLNLTLYVQDEVGNEKNISIGIYSVEIPDTVRIIVDEISVVLIVVTLIAVVTFPPLIIVLFSIGTGVAGIGALTLGSMVGPIALVVSAIAFVRIAQLEARPRR